MESAEAWKLATAVAVAVCAAALAALFTRRNDHTKWLREQRHTNYARFIAAVQAHILQDLQHRSEISMLQQHQTRPDMHEPARAVLKALELKTTMAAYPAAMDTIKEVFLAANGARLVASARIEPLIQPLVDMLLIDVRQGFASQAEEAIYQGAITFFIQEARREIATQASVWSRDPDEWLVDMETKNR